MSRAVRPMLKRQRGIAAIELAFIAPILVAMLAFSLFFGRVFWHYTVVQKAAHDATRYLSRVPLAEYKSPTRAGYAVAVAQAIIAAEMSDLPPGQSPMSITIQCDGISCDGLSPPTTLRTVVRIAMFDDFYTEPTSEVVGDNGLLLTADVTMRYVDN